jgi:glycosyltransferase involved in cell wall biosynthesis
MNSDFKKPISICFIAHFAYGALMGEKTGHIGGVERQTSLMAKWFANKGYKVSMVTWDEGQDDGVEIDGVKVFKTCRKNAGMKGLRFFWPRWSSLYAAMQRANADIYYQNCAEYVTGQTAMWCRKHGRKFVYSVASEPDCDKYLPVMRTFRERFLYKYGLKHADKIIVQTRRQQEMLRDNFGFYSVFIPMPCPGPDDEEYTDIEKSRNSSSRVLWLGRICEVKRPDRLLELAKICPDVQFDFVGPVGNSDYARDVCHQAQSIPNVTFHGPASRQKVSQFYKQAKIFCCTSDFEGFPNTFLEAWSYGLPVVSTVDPDNIISEKGLGIIGNDSASLSHGIRELLKSADKWTKASRAAREYYLNKHAFDGTMQLFEREFIDVASRSKEG